MCGQCKDRYECLYSNEGLKLENVSIKQRMGILEEKVKALTVQMGYLEHRMRQEVPKDPKSDSVHVWARQKGWAVDEGEDGQRAIYTDIQRFEDLRQAIEQTVFLIHQHQGDQLYRQPSGLPRSGLPAKAHSFSFFESLGRLPPTSGRGEMTLRNDDGRIADQMVATLQDGSLALDVITRLIHQHHQCSFPTLVSPARFENHHRQGQLKPLVLSSLLSHSVPHVSIYHPHLVHIRNFRELGVKFYDHSHDLLGVDDQPASISNIHQRTFLITYDLDHGRVRRAFVHLGIAVRMCFLLNLHCPEGYRQCRTAFEREQTKRIFWTVWFYDNMVPQLFPEERATIKSEQIKIDLPCRLPEFNRLECEQTLFVTRLIRFRLLVSEINEALERPEPCPMALYRTRLERFYRAMPASLRLTAVEPTSLWTRRSYFCVLLDYCQAWITLHQASLPLGQAPITAEAEYAIRCTSQAAVAMVHLFDRWFHGDTFDCFFRPYLYHFMSAKHTLARNVSGPGRSPALVAVSRAHLAHLLRLYQITPTKRSFGESLLEKGLIHLLHSLGIHPDESSTPDTLREALFDDITADAGWHIFPCLEPS
ncbi:hypothetical protein BY458DRAFT_487432 [Sporodiniella umbellata]|nr:hypothetical protein BY458DRAFT_487432 [Sporodiniella umbellata]